MEKRGEDLQKRKSHLKAREKVNEFPEKKDINGGFNKSYYKWSPRSRCMVGKSANGITDGCIFSHINILNN